MGSVEQDLQKYLAEHNVEDLLKDIVVKISCLDLAKKLEVDQKIIDALLDAGAKEAEDEDKKNKQED